MKRRLAAACFVSILIASALHAQSSSFGFSLGGSENLEDGVDLNLGNTIREVFFGTEMEVGTTFRIKAGQVDSEDGPRQGKIDYVQALIEYEFHEVFGSTSLFAGPALYRHRPQGDAEDESEYGLCGGVSGEFPFSRRLAFLAELTYNWVNFDDPYRFLTATGGFKVSF